MAIRRLLPLVLLGAFAACSSGGGDNPPGPATSCDPDASGAIASPLALGEVKSVRGSESSGCLRLDAPAEASKYLVVAANAGTRLDVNMALTVRTDAGAAAAVAADQQPAAARIAAAITAGEPMNPVHARLLREARALKAAGARAASATRTVSTSPAIRADIFTGTPAVGTRAWVRVPSLASGANPCTQYDSIRAEVKYVSTRAIVIQDSLSPIGGFTDTDFASIGGEFDSLIYAADTTYFGSPSDEDTNGRIVILYTPLVNKATARGSQSILAGFFWGGDLFARQGCRQSNEGELFYLLVPDPAGTINGNVRSTADVRQRTRGTVAHEFQHMINAGIRLKTNASAFESVWLDEALAHFAEEMVGRRKLGFSDTRELTFADVYDAGNGLKDFNAFFYQNLARFENYLRDPDASAPTSKAADTSLAVRGGAWALLRHAADHYAGGNIPQLTRRLVAGPDTSVANFVSKTGVAFDAAITRWLVANYTDNLGVAGLPAQYTYLSWDMRNALSGTFGSYPLVPSALATEGTTSARALTGSGTYFTLTLGAGAPNEGVQLLGSTGLTAPTDSRLILVRIQ